MKVVILGYCWKKKDGRFYNVSAGELAIMMAQDKMCVDFFPVLRVVRFTRNQIWNNFNRIKKVIVPTDIILIGGGGFGTHYILKRERMRPPLPWQLIRKKIMNSFPKNRIVQLGVTVYYGNSRREQQVLEEDKKLLDRSNYTIIARDLVSYNILHNNFSSCACRILLCPDPALYLNQVTSTKRRENRALVLLRNDRESIYNEEQKQRIIQLTRNIISNVDIEDINKKFNTSLYRCLEAYTGYKVVVTDRYHGMMFSAHTRTPCVALETIYGHKLSGGQSFFSNSIKCIKTIEEIPAAIKTVLSKPFIVKDISSYFDRLKAELLLISRTK